MPMRIQRAIAIGLVRFPLQANRPSLPQVQDSRVGHMRDKSPSGLYDEKRWRPISTAALPAKKLAQSSPGRPAKGPHGGASIPLHHVPSLESQVPPCQSHGGNTPSRDNATGEVCQGTSSSVDADVLSPRAVQAPTEYVWPDSHRVSHQ